ncbi:hypothetical protein ACQPZF_27290 [Actinosynnema sp. CS-041913]|uniref:hypothetical protein n=1 Tax=Actinosynnema sp. CS-041913 TaxID=3239917 RepID=UPI003D9446E2
MTELGHAVLDLFGDPILARLWAAEQLRRSTEEQVGMLLREARREHRSGQPVHSAYTWEELGELLGMSPQGARQRMLRRRTPLDPLNPRDRQNSE